jgi:hypothetical protein
VLRFKFETAREFLQNHLKTSADRQNHKQGFTEATEFAMLRSRRKLKARAPLEEVVERYKNLSGDSGVFGYELSSNGIVVQFKDGWKYEYTSQSAGAAAITTMHRLAIAGRGLSSFISTNVRKSYSRKFW